MDEYEPVAGVLTTDPDLVVRSWNEWLAEATGIAAGQAVGRPLLELVPDLEERGLAGRLRQALQENMAQVLAPALHRYLIPCPPRGPSAHFTHMQQRVTIVPLEEAGQASGVLIMIEDVTARLDLERDLAAQLASPDESARLQATRALASTTELQPMLVDALADESWRVRHAASGGLVRYQEPDVVAAVLRALQDGHHRLGVVSGALRVLALTDADVVPPLVEFLGSSEPDLRTYATLVLSDRHDARAVPALLAALSDVDQNVRYHAVEALGKLRALPAVAPLLEIVEQRDFFLAFPALDALTRIGDPRVVPRLIDLLEDDLLRVPAADALGQLGEESIIRPLAALLSRSGLDPGSAEAIAVARGFAALYDRYEQGYAEGGHIAAQTGQAIRELSEADRAARALLAALPAAGPADIASVARVLGWLEGPEVDRALVGLLGHPQAGLVALEAVVRRGAPVVELLTERLSSADLDVRRAAVVALGRIGDERALPALAGILVDDPLVVIAAVSALAHIGNQAAFESLLELLGHTDAAVRQAAVGALNALGHPDMPARITALLGDPNPHVRESASKIAGYYGYDGCIDCLLACCSDPEETVRVAALDSIPYLEDERVLPILGEALHSGTPRARAAAARALGYIPGPDALSHLLAALSDVDAWVRYFAARSLGAGGRQAALEVLALLARDDPAPPVRLAAIEALGHIGGPRAVGILAPVVESGDSDQARAAVVALGLLAEQDPDAVSPLLSVLRRPDPLLRLDALQALRRGLRTGASGVVNTLRWLAASEPEPATAHSAIDALAELGSSEAIAALVGLSGELAAHADSYEACVAALAHAARGAAARREAGVGQLSAEDGAGSEQGIAWLARGLSAERVAARCAVVEALARVKRPAASEYILMALDDVDPVVRMAAAVALGRLSSVAARSRLVALAQDDPDPGVRRAAQLGLGEWEVVE